MFALQTCILVLALSARSFAEGPVYTLRDAINIVDNENNSLSSDVFSREEFYEWESYDGWYNNPARPEWGGFGKKWIYSN